ncbi:MAG: hypothetical protein AAFQ90_10595 [Pseudomonadota bacterium]
MRNLFYLALTAVLIYGATDTYFSDPDLEIYTRFPRDLVLLACGVNLGAIITIWQSSDRRMFK